MISIKKIIDFGSSICAASKYIYRKPERREKVLLSVFIHSLAQFLCPPQNIKKYVASFFGEEGLSEQELSLTQIGFLAHAVSIILFADTTSLFWRIYDIKQVDRMVLKSKSNKHKGTTLWFKAEDKTDYNGAFFSHRYDTKKISLLCKHSHLVRLTVPHSDRLFHYIHRYADSGHTITRVIISGHGSHQKVKLGRERATHPTKHLLTGYEPELPHALSRLARGAEIDFDACDTAKIVSKCPTQNISTRFAAQADGRVIKASRDAHTDFSLEENSQKTGIIFTGPTIVSAREEKSEMSSIREAIRDSRPPSSRWRSMFSESDINTFG